MALRDAGPDDLMWAHLIGTYEPFIRSILTAKGLEQTAIDDVVQNVLVVVVRRLPDFERQRRGSFRAWLRTITSNCLSDYRKAHQRVSGIDRIQVIIDNLENPCSELSRVWDRRHAAHVLRVLLDAVKAEFEPVTVKVFRALAIEGTPVNEVAAAYGKSKGACYVARSKVLKRMRELARDKFGDDERLIEPLPSYSKHVT